MTDIKSQILSEVESELGPGYVMTVAGAMEKCPTLSALVANSCLIAGGVSTGFAIDRDNFEFEE